MNEAIAKLFDLSGKVAIVTGGALGIGRAIALSLSDAGSSLVIADVNTRAAHETAQEIRDKGGKAQGIYADASLVADADKVVQFAVKEFGDIHILVNNAGIYPNKPALELTEELWDRTLDINLKGTMFYSQAAARAMIKANHGGKIINIASVNAFNPTGDLAHYDSSKGGVVMLTKSLGQEFAPHGILVNAIAPGYIITPGTVDFFASCAAGAGEPPDTIREQLEARGKSAADRMPIRRLGTPDDIARAALFLASAASDYMVGATILVDGGVSIKRADHY
jgi:2-dehydro-3-deoxy-D-gluconate 5-dehydrogenase